MKFPENYNKFPANIYKPMMIVVGPNHETKKLYKFKFTSVENFYYFLNQDPEINKVVWAPPAPIQSVDRDTFWAGEPFNIAVENLIKQDDAGYQEFLAIQENLRPRTVYSHQYRYKKSVAGGALDPVAYTTNAPKIYKNLDRKKVQKTIGINIQLACGTNTTKRELFNRAVIITSLIYALEKKGYKVLVNSFMLVEKEDEEKSFIDKSDNSKKPTEVIEAIIEIKNDNQTSYQSLYKSLANIEFFRRLCFRIIEVSDVVNLWNDDYGKPIKKDAAIELLRLKPYDIYFDEPRAMGIKGKDIGEDFETVIKKLNLETIVNLPQEKALIMESFKTLKR